MKSKLWVLISLLSFTFLLAENNLQIICDREGAFIYLDNIKKSIISNGKRELSLSGGKYQIKLINHLDEEWQEIQEKTVYVDDTHMQKVHFNAFIMEEKSIDVNRDKEKQVKYQKKFKTLGNRVKNIQTGLEWQDDNESKLREKTWINAVKYCQDLSVAQHNDWRLPTAEEFLSVIEYTENGSTLSQTFKNLTVGFYWSSSESKEEQNKAFRVYLDLGCTDTADKLQKYQVKCVR